MTTNFNFTRFTNLLKLDIAENWKNSLFGLLGIYAAFLILCWDGCGILPHYSFISSATICWESFFLVPVFSSYFMLPAS